MPIPSPKPNEKQSEFIGRCVRFVIDEGTAPNTPKGRKQAVAICYSQWRRSKKSEEVENPIINAGLKDNLGYFCRLKDSTNKYYYELGNEEMKQAAIQKAQDEWIDKKSDEIILELEKEEPKQEEPKKEEIKQEEKQIEYIAPKSKAELRKGDYIVYKGKKAKILKVLEK